jgi:glycerol-3-phosphate O-acyltransferase
MTMAVAPLAARIPVAAPVTPTVVISGAALLAAPARTAVIRTAALAEVLAASL